MNALDRLVSAFSPRRGLERARARHAIGRISAYAATRADEDRGWTRLGAGAGPNAGIEGVLPRLKEIARQQVRDNPWAHRALRIAVAHKVGTGIVPRFDTGDRAADKRAQLLWDRFARRCDAHGMLDAYGLQALAERSRMMDGEALWRFRFLTREQQRRRGLPLPLVLECVEGDALESPGGNALTGPRIVQGVEFGADGMREAYHFRREDAGAAARPDRVPAEFVRHVFRVLRPGQVRGVPDWASIMARLGKLGDFEEASLDQAKVQACLAAFVMGGNPPEGGNQRPEYFTPGSISYLPDGEEVRFNTPSGAGGFEPYAFHFLMSFAVAFDLTYDQLTGDMRQANFSSLRAGRTDQRRLAEQDQWLMTVPAVCEPTADAFVRAAVLAGELEDRPGGYPVKWQPPRHEMVDPVRETGALVQAVRAGVMTWGQAVAELGWDPREQIAEIKRWNAEFDGAGLILDTDPRRVATSGQAQDAKQLAAVEIDATGAARPLRPEPEPDAAPPQAKGRLH